jgi:hypothetical protein
VAALAWFFNLLVLNLALLLASLPVVTVPVAANAAWTALDRWRSGGEDRVGREFVTALRSGQPLRTTVLVGVPLAMTALSVEEVHYFLRGGGLMARACFGLGLAALVVTLTALGYVLLLVARSPWPSAAALWSLCIRLAVRNLFVTGPLFLVEMVGATLLALADPALVLIGLPIALVYAMRTTAQYGFRRAEKGWPS